MATISSFDEQVRNREADWKGRAERRFRWLRLRLEWGRVCYIIHPVDGHLGIVWWEWERA